MNPLEVRSLLPERPNPLSWLAFVLLGLIGLYLAGGALSAAVGGLGPTKHVIGILGGFVGAYALTTAYLEASALDDAEGSQ